MGKHRHQKQYRRTVVAAVAVGVIGIPSVAMACTDWPGDGQRQDQGSPASAGDRWDGPDWYSRWSSQQHGEPTRAPSDTPAASASPSKPAEPSHKPKKAASTAPATRSAAPAAKPTKAAPKPTTAAPGPTTATPKPSATASKPAPAASSPSASSPAATDGAQASGAVAQVVDLVNAERAKVGCSPVKVNSTLTGAAQDHSEDMAASGSMSHTGSDGSSPGDRITRAGYSWSTYGENVAYGYSTPEQVMAGWMASPGHKENILNCAFEEIGVGLAQPGSYWTQDFGTAR
ncbi:CAP domain-containing protein [Streptomyces fungicidicus]|uniref:CAP domain-containing protein n=1 Tax=Streptomyces fungicidicus TaxID=68203 RepID=UPI0037965262